ncbi:UDP-4-amino-4,6-dideoxy-N-acetyl-beta-L-altrosamine transaminase [Neptuniibacter sp. QD48_11]|uniref:UDP-4-amino-4, 6-dideoxy-N-acetyl-beta-L-altrosamine transaminase n=1 Tax=unclassified Neptuniibacter TaxID=2630693 RepID=UPI0039F61FBB
MIPYGTQDITQEDIEAVTKTLKSAFLTQGPKVSEFESSIANYCGSSHAIATNSATSALHIACLALGLSKGDHLWTSPNSFVASANCGLYCGASVDFVDIELTHFNLCPDALRQKLIEAEKLNQLPKILVVVDFAGEPCNMATISNLAKQYNIKVIEDASHAIGSRYQNIRTGSGEYSDITIFSFHPVKIITSGEGGCAVTNDQTLAKRMRSLMSHGITRDSQLLKNNDGPWYYEQQDLGFNYRMTDIHAALGLEQLKRIDQYIKTRHAIADHYEELLSDLPIQLPSRRKTSLSSLHLYPIQLQDDTPIDRLTLFNQLREDGIGVNVHYIPIHLQPYYKNLGFAKGDYPNAEKYYERAITIPLHPKLSQTEIAYISDSLHKYLKP